MTSKSNKQTRDANRIQHKTLLRLASRADNLDELFYPHQSADERHPHTQEIILLAEERGWSQDRIASSCGVSQPVVSGWKHGDGKATMQQLAPLSRQLSPKAPGKTFHIFKAVDKVSLTLPDDWEVKMLAKSAGCSPELLEKALWGSIQQEVYEEFEQQARQLDEEYQCLKEWLEGIKEYHPLMVQELAENQSLEQLYQQQVAKILTDDPVLAQLNEDDQKLVIDRKVERPEISQYYQHQFNHLKKQILTRYPALSEDNLLEALDSKKSEIANNIDAFKAERNEAISVALSQRSPLNKFDSSVFPLTLEKPFSHDVEDTQITELCNKIFKQVNHYQIDTQIAARDSWHAHKAIKINKSAKELFTHYINTAEFEISAQDIQLCGQHIISVSEDNYHRTQSINIYRDFDLNDGCKPHNPWATNTDISYREIQTFDLFTLHSQKLAIVRGRYHEKKECHFFTLHEFNTLDELLEYTKPILSDTEQKNWKTTLMQMGYTTTTATLVY